MQLQPTAPLESPTTVSHRLLDGLLAAGVRTVFGIPGGAIATLLDAFLDRPQLDWVTAKHETSAVYAAVGLARASRGVLGAVLVTSGPGVLNALCGLASAHCDHAPLLLLVGEVARPRQGRGALQDGSAAHLNVRRVVGSLCKRVVAIDDPMNAERQFRTAIAAATSGVPGPVVVTLPIDVSSALVPDAPAPPSDHVERESAQVGHVGNEALGVLDSSARGLLFVGSGARGGDGPSRVRALAEQLDWPVMTTPKAKGCFPESHRLALGVFGLGGHPSTHAYLERPPDVVVALGTSMGDLATDDWSPQLAARHAFVQVDLRAEARSVNYPISHFVKCGVAEFASRALREATDAPSNPKTFGVRRTSIPSSRALSPADAVRQIQALCPADTFFAVDSGEHFSFATHYLQIERPDAFFAAVGLGAMGSGIGAAIGHAFARATRSVAICGDGGWLMYGNEVATAAEAGVAPWLFVFNDQRLGMVERGMSEIFGRTPAFGTGGDVNIARMARGLGAHAVEVRTTAELSRAVADFPPDRPTVVDVRIDPSARLRSSRTGALAEFAHSKRDGGER